MRRWWHVFKTGLWTGFGVALLLLVMWFLRLFMPLQLTLTTIYYVPKSVTENVVIIQLDDASLQAYGRSPNLWHRDVYADLVEQMTRMGARVLVFDLIFSEPAEGDETFLQAIREARTGETRTRFVMVGAGVGIPSVNNINNLPGLEYSSGLNPLPEFVQEVDYVAYVNVFPDVDGVIRRQPSRITTPQYDYWSLPITAYLAYLRVPPGIVQQVVSYEASELKVVERVIPTDEAGVWLQDYFGAPTYGREGTFTVVSLLNILEGDIPSDAFEDKIVIVGLMNSFGALDQYPVPSARAGELMAGVEIQANAIESLLQNRVLSPLSDGLYILVFMGLALVSSVIYMRPVWQIKLVMMIVAIIAVLIIGTLLYNLQGIVMGLFHPLLAVSLPALLMIGWDISREIRLRQRSDFLLESVVAVSQQRLELSRITRLLVTDIQRIAPQSDGVLWLVPMASGQLTIKQVETWGTRSVERSSLSSLDLLTLQKPLNMGGLAYYPMLSQGRLWGVLMLCGRLTQRQENLLHDLTGRVAPTLEAAQLYTLTERQRALLQTVLTQSPSPIVALDGMGMIALHNQQFNEVAPVGHQMRFSTWLESIFKDEDIIDKIRTSLAIPQPFQQPVKTDEKHYLLQAAPLETDLRWVIVFNDVTDLAQLNHLKTRMIRMASHDLKNPLSRINGYVQLIDMNENLNDEDRGFLYRVMEASSEMESLITDLLNLERLRSGESLMERLDMHSLVKQVYRRHEPEAQIKRQDYRFIASEQSIYVHGDFNQLSQVASNLINNAIKYTPESGQIEVELMTTNLDEKIIMRLEVRDTGYGIPKSSQEKLFTEFYRVRTSQTAGISGTGLGLSLVKSVVDAHQGHVGFVSEEGKGSRFYVELALHADQSSPASDSNFWDKPL